MSNGVIAQLFSGRLDQELLRVVPPPEDDETLEILLSALDRFLEREVDGASIDRNGSLPESVLEGCKQLGLFGLIIPEEFGGFGLGARSYFKIMERVAARCGATAVTLGAHQSIGLKALLLAGSQEQKQMWLPACASGERIAAFALTEPEAGSDAASIKTRLVEEGDDLILDGGKIWITNGGFASLFTVFARLGDTIRAVIVPRELHGLSTGEEEKKLGIRGSSTTTVTFEGVRVPRANLLSGDGFRLAMEILNNGRGGLAAGTLGPARDLIGLAREHTQGRKQFGRSLSEFALVRQSLASMALDLAGIEALVDLTGRLIDAGAPHSLEAAAAKIYSSDALWRIADGALQLAGGAGYMSEYPYERILRDARINRIFEGTNEVLRLFVALKGVKGPAQELREIAAKPLLALPRLTARAWRRRKVALLDSSAASQQLAQSVRTLAASADLTLRRHRKAILERQCDLKRLADMAIECTAMAAMIVSGERYVEAFVDRGRRRVAAWAKELGRDLEHVARLVLEEAS